VPPPAFQRSARRAFARRLPVAGWLPLLSPVRRSPTPSPRFLPRFTAHYDVAADVGADAARRAAAHAIFPSAARASGASNICLREQRVDAAVMMRCQFLRRAIFACRIDATALSPRRRDDMICWRCASSVTPASGVRGGRRAAAMPPVYRGSARQRQQQRRVAVLAVFACHSACFGPAAATRP